MPLGPRSGTCVTPVPLLAPAAASCCVQGGRCGSRSHSRTASGAACGAASPSRSRRRGRPRSPPSRRCCSTAARRRRSAPHCRRWRRRSARRAVRAAPAQMYLASRAEASTAVSARLHMCLERFLLHLPLLWAVPLDLHSLLRLARRLGSILVLRLNALVLPCTRAESACGCRRASAGRGVCQRLPYNHF
jgi:hypothetical protein